MIQRLRQGFSMLELVMVIVVLGIVSSIGAEIIANVYEGYIVQRAQHRASIKTEIAATQIANRLAYAIPGTVVRRVGTTGAPTDITMPAADGANVLQWVGADMDSFNASTQNAAGTFIPGWSGFCDFDASSTTSISTPGSNLALTTTIRTNLGLISASPKIYFPVSDGLRSYNAAFNGLNNITLTNPNPAPPAVVAKISEHYKLATSSYALEAKNDGELWLHYNFSPIRDTTINGTSVRLLRNVTTFRFRGDGRTIRFKICARESIGDDNITVCKEKAVF